MSVSTHPEVIVIGAGPVGLIAGCELARRGVAVGRRLRHAKVVAGEHLPHIADDEVQTQLGAVCGAQHAGHTVVTVADGQIASAAGHGQLHVLVTSENTPVTGYDAVIADPKGVVAQRLGLAKGGRFVVRPDGYLRAVCALDDTNTIAEYFAKVGS
jgi:thioredoxin reductase